MTVLKMPDGAVVDFGDRSRGEIQALIAKKYPDLVRATPTERMAEADAGQPDPKQPRYGLEGRLNDKVESDAARPWVEPSEFEKSIVTGAARVPGRIAGALGDLVSGYAAPVGAMIGDIARRATGKPGFASLEEATANDPAGLKNIPTSEDVLNKASEITGVELHQPKGAAGAAGELVGGALVGGVRGLPQPAKVAAAEKAAADAASAAKSAALAHPERARTLADVAGALKTDDVRATLAPFAKDPAKLAALTPEEQELVRRIAGGGKIEALGDLLAKIPVRGVVPQLIIAHLGGPVGQVVAGAARTGQVIQGVTGVNRARNAKILQEIIGGQAPPVAQAAPRAALPPAAPPPAIAAERAPAPAPAAEPVTPAERLDWIAQRRQNWARTNPQFDFGDFRPPTKRRR